MRKIISFAAFSFFLTACSSNPSSDSGETSGASPSVNQDAEASRSQVLSKQKCPKHSKLVNGKCTLQVESDD